MDRSNSDSDNSELPLKVNKKKISSCETDDTTDYFEKISCQRPEHIVSIVSYLYCVKCYCIVFYS